MPTDYYEVPKELQDRVEPTVAKAKACGAPFYLPCHEIHGPDSCFMFMLKRWPSGFSTALKVYAPIHFLPMLIFRRKALMKDPIGTLLHTAWSTARSTAFLTSFTAFFLAAICRWRQFRQRDESFGPFLGGIAAGLSLPFEKASRRVELMLYCLPRFVEGLWKYFEKRHMVKGFYGGEVLLFSISWAFLMLFYHTQPKAIKPTYRSLIGLLLGKN